MSDRVNVLIVVYGDELGELKANATSELRRFAPRVDRQAWSLEYDVEELNSTKGRYRANVTATMESNVQGPFFERVEDMDHSTHDCVREAIRGA